MYKVYSQMGNSEKAKWFYCGVAVPCFTKNIAAIAIVVFLNLIVFFVCRLAVIGIGYLFILLLTLSYFHKRSLYSLAVSGSPRKNIAAIFVLIF